MTDTNQKLREALQAISHIDDTTNHSVDASAALDRIGQIARQALALPTAEQVDDINVAESFTSVTKTAAPVGERDAFEREMRCEEEWGHRSLKKRQNGQYENWQVDLMWAVWQARAALSAGDAVDAQRYRWLKGRSQVCLNQVWFGGYTTRQLDGDFLSRDSALSAIESAIDAAMRKAIP